MVERCIRCDVEGIDVKLFDAIYDGQMEKICERCSVIENVPIIKKPDVLQLKKSEQTMGVNARMNRMSGVIPVKKEESFFIEDKLKELDKNPELELPERDKLNLVQYFNWIIMKNRRLKKFTQKQLADALGESEVAIQMIEKAKFPENAESLIKKLEQFFQVKLRKINEAEKIMKEQEKQEQPILLDEKGHELENIPEEEFEIIEEEVEEESDIEIIETEPKAEIVRNIDEELKIKIEREKNIEKERIDNVLVDVGTNSEKIKEPEVNKENIEHRELDMKQVNPNAVTIEDLRAMHRKKVEVTKREKLEEQEKIEERQRLIEARKEELRLMKEKESNELDDVLGGSELLDKKDDFDNSEYSRVDSESANKKRQEFDNELI
jgi:ribosome-binding protein aMBF1 (putative translation factor)